VSRHLDLETLLLNASFEPICLVTARRAVVLVLYRKAEVVETGDGQISSATRSFPVPSVIRLLHLVRIPRQAKAALSRRAVYTRDRGRCAYCGRVADTIDHVVPRSRGGRHEWGNVVASCGPCNRAKGNQLLSELGWALRAKPYTPRGAAWLLVAVRAPRPNWEPYLVAAG
jgi:5-methylcytosine-specific restriction endonuclease McrA